MVALFENAQHLASKCGGVMFIHSQKGRVYAGRSPRLHQSPSAFQACQLASEIRSMKSKHSESVKTPLLEPQWDTFEKETMQLKCDRCGFLSAKADVFRIQSEARWWSSVMLKILKGEFLSFDVAYSPLWSKILIFDKWTRSLKGTNFSHQMCFYPPAIMSFKAKC